MSKTEIEKAISKKEASVLRLQKEIEKLRKILTILNEG
jgi:hypothetical protein